MFPLLLNMPISSHSEHSLLLFPPFLPIYLSFKLSIYPFLLCSLLHVDVFSMLMRCKKEVMFM